MTHTVYETSGHLTLKSNENDIPATCFATRPDPPGWTGDGGWTGGTKGRREKARQGGRSEAGKERGSEPEGTKEEGKEGGSEAGRRKEGLALRTKLKSCSRCNSSDLKTIPGTLLIEEHR